MSYQHLSVDESVERVLSTLRTAEHSPEFEARMTLALQVKLTAAEPSAWHRIWPAFHTLPAAAAVVVVCGLVLIPLLRDAQLHRTMPSMARTRAQDRQTAGLKPRNEAASEATAQPSTAMHRAPFHATVKGQSMTPQLTSVPEASATGRDLSSSELAAAEAAAASLPEPPLPLTSEERLIRRFTERHNAYQLAALDPRTEPAHEREENEEFRHFFAPPPEPSGNLPLPPLEGVDETPVAATPASDAPGSDSLGSDSLGSDSLGSDSPN